MNRDNIRTTIDILKRAQAFNINNFQRSADQVDERSGFKYAETEADLHKCGNTACIAGYIAISPEWAAQGGWAELGTPVCLNSKGNEGGALESMSEFWDISESAAESIIYGTGYGRFIAENMLVAPKLWSYITKEDAISLFEQLLVLDSEGVTI
jgi:hypothetical protein